MIKLLVFSSLIFVISLFVAMFIYGPPEIKGFLFFLLVFFATICYTVTNYKEI